VASSTTPAESPFSGASGFSPTPLPTRSALNRHSGVTDVARAWRDARPAGSRQASVGDLPSVRTRSHTRLLTWPTAGGCRPAPLPDVTFGCRSSTDGPYRGDSSGDRPGQSYRTHGKNRACGAAKRWQAHEDELHWLAWDGPAQDEGPAGRRAWLRLARGLSPPSSGQRQPPLDRLLDLDHAQLAHGEDATVGPVEVEDDEEHRRDHERQDDDRRQGSPARQAGDVAHEP